MKWDGYRIEAVKHRPQFLLFSRRPHDFTKRFARVVEAVSKTKISTAILDGEVVVVDRAGRPCFHNRFDVLRPRPYGNFLVIWYWMVLFPH